MIEASGHNTPLPQHTTHVTVRHVSIATTKTTRVVARRFDLNFFDLFGSLSVPNCRKVPSPVPSDRACPAFAMIYLVRRLYDPDATSAP